MRQSTFFIPTQKEPPKDETARNAQLLMRAGFVDKLMAGSYTLLPLAERVITKIERVIREELNDTGATEMRMPLLHPRSIWDDSGRWERAQEIMFQLEKRDREYGLSFTHEEIVMDILRKRTISYRDLPLKIYQFSTKFRDEPRARSGLLRGIEFGMKDLYSIHESEEDMRAYYKDVTEAYTRIFKRCGLEARIVEAGGGVFVDDTTHEFQVLTESGEDTVFYCEQCDWAQNKEIADVKEGDSCPACEGTVATSRAIEVGNIFPLGTWYAEKMGAHFTAKDGSEKPFWFASYGIGTSRLIGTLAEVLSDEQGLVWPMEVAPFRVHLLNLTNETAMADTVYSTLSDSGIEVLYDDRAEASAGEKLMLSDLIGIPVRLVVGSKSAERNTVGISYRGSDDAERHVGITEAVKEIRKHA